MARQPLLKCYRDQIATYMQRKYGIPAEQAMQYSLELCKEYYKPLTAVVEETKEDGIPVIRAVDLATWFDQQQNNILSDSGSVYCQHKVKLSRTIEMIIEMMTNRKKEKKLQLKMKAAGNTSEELKHYYAQTLIKITMNSLPGNYGSPYSLFYSKANYNAITSCGRSLIGYANSEIEAVLGGNFAWFSIDELLQHLIAHINKGIDGELVESVMKQYDLKRATHSQLFEYFKEGLTRYHRYTDFSQLTDMVSKLTDSEVQYFWYFQNFRHMFMGNSDKMKAWFHELFDIARVDFSDTSVKPDDLFKLDGALVILCNVAFHEYVDPGDSEIQVYDLPKARPDLAIKFVHIARYVEYKLHDIDNLFRMFLFTPINRTSVRTRPNMLRNSAVISDTDSVIFTVKDWVAWYTGDVYSIAAESYHIACVMIYWITQAISHTLLLYSQAHGARDEYEKVMAMKNEFLYTVMILADVKKHYAGIVSVQEGVLLPTPEIDIKGVQFKGSDICKLATNFAKNFSEHDVLDNMHKHGRISAHELIDKVRNFELQIRRDLEEGKSDWFKSLSIRKKTDYSTPMSSNWYYYYTWQEVFAPKYGDILIPTKVPAVPIHFPNKEYLEWLSRKSPDIYKRMVEFLSKNRPPTTIVINPVGGKVPPEIIPLVKFTDIIYHNVRPCHLLLKQLGISCGFEDSKLLFSDVYSLP